MDGSAEPIACGKVTELSVGEVLRYFQEFGKDVKVSLPPLKPKGGEVYIISTDGCQRKSKCIVDS